MMKYIIANWKSNKNILEANEWVKSFNQGSSDDKKVIIAPPFSLLLAVSHLIKTKQLNVSLAVQDISPFPAGSYTGAISVRNIENMGVEFAIVGHSERRNYFKETHLEVANKIAQCVEAKITPVLCLDVDYLAKQAQAIEAKYLEKCVVAYEPLGAIGTGNNAPVDQVKSVVTRIKKIFGEVVVLYGGSVTEDNVADYTAVSDGCLVGGASLDVGSFSALVQRA
jgi:triosephosphate isomerase